jgi:LytS/YehU family sensor histidine kinase
MHALKVRCKSSNSNWSELQEITFVVATPFYRTLWFKTLLSMIIAMVVLLFVKFRIRKYRTQLRAVEQTRQEMISLRQMALSASVNPHFIFNTLNAIQYLVNDNQPAKANDYIARFAIMMRGVLQSSDNNFISLGTELSRLENYLQLEKLRIGDKIDWEVVVDSPILMSNLEIPQMIIQPFVENSIWHGITHLEGRGLIRIHIFISPQNHCVITITDNGVGLMNHINMSTTQHQSKGIQLIRERLTLLNDSNSLEAVTISNRTDGNSGVVVTILLTANAYRFVKP